MFLRLEYTRTHCVLRGVFSMEKSPFSLQYKMSRLLAGQRSIFYQGQQDYEPTGTNTVHFICCILLCIFLYAFLYVKKGYIQPHTHPTHHNGTQLANFILCRMQPQPSFSEAIPQKARNTLCAPERNHLKILNVYTI